jgi:alpha-amylase
VRQRIADYFTDLLAIGFSGFRIDAAKHISPTNLAEIFKKLKNNLGGSFP